MNLAKKKRLAARVLKVGANKIKFNNERLDEIKEAITGQDIKDLVKSKAIIITEGTGRKKKEKRKNKRSFGKVKKKIKKRKMKYVKLTRKLRNYLKNLKNSEKIKLEEYDKLRIRIKAKAFRSKSHIKEVMGEQ